MFLGTDPEFFLFSEKRGFVSASEVFPLKGNPLKPDFSGGKVFRDGFAVEINVSPRTCRAELTQAVKQIFTAALGEARKKDPSLQLLSTPVAEVSLSYIDELPKDVKMFGCDPSWNAYTREKGSIPLDGGSHPFRYAGGHIHFGMISHTKEWIEHEKKYYEAAGYKNGDPIFNHLNDIQKRMEEQTRFTEENGFTIVKLLDLTVGLPLSLIFKRKDEFLRRRYYGRAGEFRFQPWGLEYRVPSPRIWNHPVVAGLSLGVGRSVIEEFEVWKEKWNSLNEKDPLFEKKLQSAINDGDGGEDLLQRVRGFYNPSLIEKISKEGEKLWKLSEMSLPSIDGDFEYGYGNYILDSMGESIWCLWEGK